VQACAQPRSVHALNKIQSLDVKPKWVKQGKVDISGT